MCAVSDSGAPDGLQTRRRLVVTKAEVGCLALTDSELFVDLDFNRK